MALNWLTLAGGNFFKTCQRRGRKAGSVNLELSGRLGS